MARPQRSPRMRDHWRDEGHRREDSVYRGRHRERSSDRRKSSATLKKRERSIDVEVKIKGRATAEEAHNISSRKPDKDQGRELSSYPEQRPSRSPRGRRLREGSYGRYKGSSRDRHRDPSRNRKVAGKRADNRKRSRSRSPRRAAALSYRERQRSPDLFYSRHTNQHVDTRTRHREHQHSRLSSPRRADYHSLPHEDNASLGGDFYVPSTGRPRHRSPVGKGYRGEYSHERRSPVPRSARTKGSHRPFEEEDLFHNYIPGTRERSPGPTRQSRALSRGRQQKSSHRRRSRSREGSERPTKRLRSSRSPLEADKPRGNRRMQSTHRIQVLDSTSRPQSPPRPIPSYDANNQPSGVFPMHGANRPGRLQLNTQQSHATSPQWTPTSSHHGSPQSASPYSHGRGGWVGQPQQYQGQPG